MFVPSHTKDYNSVTVLTNRMREGLMSQVVVWLSGGYVDTASVAQMGALNILGPPSQDPH